MPAEGCAMTDALLLVVVLGTVALGVGVDVLAAVAWLRRRP
jgi:hypothetical protein